MVEKMSHVTKNPTIKWFENSGDGRCPHLSNDLNREGVIVSNISSFIILLVMISRWGEITLLVDSTNDLIWNRCVRPGEIIHPPLMFEGLGPNISHPLPISTQSENALSTQINWTSHNWDGPLTTHILLPKSHIPNPNLLVISLIFCNVLKEKEIDPRVCLLLRSRWRRWRYTRDTEMGREMGDGS